MQGSGDAADVVAPSEVELKFQVPPERRAALRRAVATASAQRTRLQAAYADSADQRLSSAGLALRLRKEGRRWVQTLKGRGDGLMQRLEHEVTVPASGIDPHHPLPDPSRHAGSAAGALLQQALGSAGVELRLLYRTDVQRLHRRVRHAGAVIEIAYDQGRLLADGRSEAIDEVEFELISGPPAALASLAQRWAQRFELWWDCRSKAERGTRMAFGTVTVPAVHAVPPHWTAKAPAAELGTAALHAALRQALPNAAELASGSGTPEHLHQLRVALRRLRTVLRMWATWLPDPEAAAALEQAWKAPFGLLGEARDADVREATLWPELRQAGAPELDRPPSTALPDVGACVRGPVFTLLMLQSLALAMQPAAAGPPTGSTGSKYDSGTGARQAARAALAPAWRHILRDAGHFAEADVAAQHRTRKRLKRFRYLLDMLHPIFKPRPTKQLLKAVRRALNALGELNDLHVAEVLFRDRAESDPRAWFAVGFLSARRAPALAAAVAALAPLKDAPRVWSKG